jgi:hypothetical protein
LGICASVVVATRHILYQTKAKGSADMRADLLYHFTALQKLHSSSAGFHSGFHAGFHQNGDDQVETTSTTTTHESAAHHA